MLGIEIVISMDFFQTYFGTLSLASGGAPSALPPNTTTNQLYVFRCWTSIPV